MVKFERVKDPERVKDGDLLVFPAAEARLNLKASTFGKMGLSIGGTCRSRNSAATVRKWLERTDAAQRTFMICGVQYKSRPSEDQLLLSMDACGRLEVPEVPEISCAALVPFGPAMWSAPMWDGCWDDVHDGAVRRRIAETVGARGCSFGRTDRAAIQAWNANVGRSPDYAVDGVSLPYRDYDESECWLPTVPVGETGPTEDTFRMDDFLHWGGAAGWSSRESRVWFRRGFLAKLAGKGAVTLRPDDEFNDAVTEEIAARLCANMEQRFLKRAEVCRTFLRSLKGNIKADAARARVWKAQAARSRRAAGDKIATAVRKAVMK